MCFSAEASFIASGVLLTAGTVAVIKARKTSVRYFAAIPLLFGIQQGIEGFQWLVEKPSPISTALGYGFLFFAFLVWPFYIPFSVMMMEENKKRRRLLQAMTGIGTLGSAHLLYAYLNSPLEICVVNHSIDYNIAIPLFTLGISFYLAGVSMSLLSTRWRAKLLGVTTAVAFFLSLIAYEYAFASVWCFFSAILSVVVLAEVFAHTRHGKQLR